MSQNQKQSSAFTLTSLLIFLGIVSEVNAQDGETEGSFFDSKSICPFRARLTHLCHFYRSPWHARHHRKRCLLHVLRGLVLWLFQYRSLTVR